MASANGVACEAVAPIVREFEGQEGLRLVADAWGDPAAPPVLLLHGGGQTRHAWGGTGVALARAGFYAVALDMRGHGESGWADDGDYTVAAYAADLHLVVSSFERRPALVGASLGGITSLVLEGEAHPGGASAVVLVDVTPRLQPEGLERIVAFMSARPDGFHSLDDAADVVAEYLPHRPRPSDTSGLAKNLRLHEDGRYRWHWDPKFLEKRAPEAHRADFPERMCRAAASISVPLLLVRGRMSEIVSEENAREFRELVPRCEYVDVKGASHMVAGDRNDAFCAAVVEFLSRKLLEGPPSGGSGQG